MAPPDATPKSLFPAALTRAASAEPPPGAFATPATVEFPMVTDPEDADMSAFGSRVQADHDLEMIDARVCHVRDVRYGPGSHPPDASGVAPVTPPVARTRKRAGRRLVASLLAGSAVGLLVAAAGVSLFFFLTR